MPIMMENDASADDIIEIIPCISNRIIEYLENTLESLEDFEKIINNKFNYEDLINIRGVTEFQEQLNENKNQILENVSKNGNYVDGIKEEMEKGKLFVNNIQKEITKKEEEIKLLKEKHIVNNKRKESLMNKRDEVQICKLLTNTTFAYKGSNISGFIIGQSSKQTEYFELSPDQSENEIRTILYNIIKKVSFEENQN